MRLQKTKLTQCWVQGIVHGAVTFKIVLTEETLEMKTDRGFCSFLCDFWSNYPEGEIALLTTKNIHEYSWTHTLNDQG